MSDDQGGPVTERWRANLVRAGTMPTSIGALAWFVGLATTNPALLQMGQAFIAAGFGALAAAAARALWEYRTGGRRLHPVALVAPFVAGAVVTYAALGEVGTFVG